MAIYPPAIQKLVPHGAEDPTITPRVVILHIAVSEGDSLHDYFSTRSGGVESHFYVRRSGVVEQYRDTGIQADANTDANGFAISIETQGMEYGQWGPDQLAAIKDLIDWCSDVHGIPKSVPQSWDGSGVGFHVQFPGRWDRRGATCPGPDRQAQYWDDIVPWMGGGTQSVPSAPSKPQPKPKPKSDDGFYDPPVRRSVKKIQRIVGVTADGLYGQDTKDAVAHYQQDTLGVAADGLWGKQTERAYKAHSKPKPQPQPSSGLLKRGSTGKAVRDLQRGLNDAFPAYSDLAVDGDFGPATEKVVREFQRRSGLSTDGVVGPETRGELAKYGITP